MTPENTNKRPEIQALDDACDNCHNGRVTFETGPNGEKTVTVNGKVVYSTNSEESNSAEP